MNKNLKKIPKFNSEDEEREFWAKADVTEYFDFSNPQENPKFPKLKFTTKPITIRMPVRLLHRLKHLANTKDVPYQSLIKIYLDEKVREELG